MGTTKGECSLESKQFGSQLRHHNVVHPPPIVTQCDMKLSMKDTTGLGLA